MNIEFKGLYVQPELFDSLDVIDIYGEDIGYQPLCLTHALQVEKLKYRVVLKVVDSEFCSCSVCDGTIDLEKLPVHGD